MSTLAVTDRPARAAKVIQPAWVRIMHWVNAVAILLMITSGWQVYNASPLFKFSFPAAITLGGWLAGALLWHFAPSALRPVASARNCCRSHLPASSPIPRRR